MRYVVALLAAVTLFGQAKSPSSNNNDLGYMDTPILPGLPYHVHDPARPHPAQVAAEPGKPPSDAIVLFDGRDLSQWTFKNVRTWKIDGGVLEVVPGAGDMTSKETFGDLQLHLEFAAPVPVRNTSQNRGNSGIFLQGLYEIQVLDDWDNPTYADGQTGAIYGQWPPLVNPARKPGEWQVYDILFEAPIFSKDGLDGGKLLKPAYVTVILNGVLLHHHKEIMGPTVHRALAKYAAQPAEGPIVLQDHQQPVRYRNIWVRRIGTYDQPEKK
jgi:hypothetical protein